MKRFTDAGRKAIENDNLYTALSLALMIPDICGSLEDPGTGKSQRRYEKWFENWALSKFTGPDGHVFLSAQDCFQLRCSLIHSGTADIEPKKRDILSKIVFFDKTQGAHLTWVVGNTINGVKQDNFLQMKADLFSLTMFDCADEWDSSIKEDATIQAEKAKLLVIHSRGAVFGGIMFG